MNEKYFFIFATIYTVHCSLNYDNEFRLDQPFYESSPMIPEYYDYPLIFFKNKKTASGYTQSVLIRNAAKSHCAVS